MCALVNNYKVSGPAAKRRHPGELLPLLAIRASRPSFKGAHKKTSGSNKIAETSRTGI